MVVVWSDIAFSFFKLISLSACFPRAGGPKDFSVFEEITKAKWQERSQKQRDTTNPISSSPDQQFILLPDNHWSMMYMIYHYYQMKIHCWVLVINLVNYNTNHKILVKILFDALHIWLVILKFRYVGIHVLMFSLVNRSTILTIDFFFLSGNWFYHFI